jgi:hypothetical protein
MTRPRVAATSPVGADEGVTFRRASGRPFIDAAEQPATDFDSRRLDRRLPPSRITRVQARSRLEAELRTIANDLLGPNESDEFPSACAGWVATTTEAAVASVCDSALEALVQALDSLLVGVPPDVARHLDRARARHDFGFA